MSVYSSSGINRKDEITVLFNYAKSLLHEFKKPPSEWQCSPYAALRHVKNHVGRIDVNIQENVKHLEVAESCLPKLVKISKNGRPDAFLRLKNGAIKVGHEPGDIRNILFRERYGKEQEDAARRLGIPRERIASGEVKLMMDRKINWLKRDNEGLLACKHVFNRCEAEVVKYLYPNEKLSDSSARGSAWIEEELPDVENEIRNTVVRFSDSSDYRGPTEYLEDKVPERTWREKIVSWVR